MSLLMRNIIVILKLEYITYKIMWIPKCSFIEGEAKITISKLKIFFNA